MTKKYYGDINGIFKSGQSQFDFECYKDGVEYYYWYHCRCEFYNIREKYCKNCFSSYKNYKELYPDPLAEDEKQFQQLAQGFRYEFVEGDIDYLNEKIDELVEQLGGNDSVQNILSQINYTIDLETFKHQYDEKLFNRLINHSGYFNLLNCVVSNIGKYCVLEDTVCGPWYRYFFGLQIKKCLELHNKCIFKTAYD